MFAVRDILIGVGYAVALVVFLVLWSTAGLIPAALVAGVALLAVIAYQVTKLTRTRTS